MLHLLLESRFSLNKQKIKFLFPFFLIAILIGQNKIDDFDMYGYPTKWEFSIYKEAWALMWDAPPGIEYERVIQKAMAKKYNTTYEHIGKILMKLDWYDQNQPYPPKKLVETMSWKEFQRLFKKMGTPWPKDKKKQ